MTSPPPPSSACTWAGSSAPTPDVSPYAASAFYAVDRYASWRKVWGEDYQNGGLILADRYTTSNAVHQGAKCSPEERQAFFRWLDEFEHDKLGLPRADLVVYLDMPTEQAVELLRSREASTNTKADIHELDTAYLAACPHLRPSGGGAAGLDRGPLSGPMRAVCAPSRISTARSGHWSKKSYELGVMR